FFITRNDRPRRICPPNLCNPVTNEQDHCQSHNYKPGNSKLFHLLFSLYLKPFFSKTSWLQKHDILTIQNPCGVVLQKQLHTFPAVDFLQIVRCLSHMRCPESRMMGVTGHTGRQFMFQQKLRCLLFSPSESSQDTSLI